MSRKKSAYAETGFWGSLGSRFLRLLDTFGFLAGGGWPMMGLGRGRKVSGDGRLSSLLRGRGGCSSLVSLKACGEAELVEPVTNKFC